MFKIKNKIKELEERVEKNEKLIKFLLENDRDACVINTRWGFWESEATIEYIYKGEFCSVKIPYGVCGGKLSIIENNKESAIFEEAYEKKYFKVYKDKKIFVEITDLKEKFENKEKVSENLKQSAEALGNSLKEIFDKFKQSDNENSKNSVKNEQKKCRKCDCDNNQQNKNPKKRGTKKC
ncbi:MAG: hypothetical protein IJ371_05280 [Clostridia bacterium]|nr:hypothetical protein [Clostridia bacterium]